MICRDDLELRWRLPMCENEFSHISLLLYISTVFSLSLRESSACRKSMKVARSACLSTKIKMVTLREAVADLRCCSVSRDFRHLGVIRRLF